MVLDRGKCYNMSGIWFVSANGDGEWDFILITERQKLFRRHWKICK